MSVELIAERVGLDYARDGNATVAIQDFSLRMTESEFITVVGPSGCGKSSFLNLVAGFLLALALIGLVIDCVVVGAAVRGEFTRRRYAAVTNATRYWIALFVMWVMGTATLYLVPRLV